MYGAFVFRACRDNTGYFAFNFAVTEYITGYSSTKYIARIVLYYTGINSVRHARNPPHIHKRSNTYKCDVTFKLQSVNPQVNNIKHPFYSPLFL
jgi:hypothetical protein